MAMLSAQLCASLESSPVRPAAPMLRVFIRRLLRHGMAVLIGLALLIGPVSPSLAALWGKQRSEPSNASGAASLLQEVDHRGRPSNSVINCGASSHSSAW